MNHKTAEIIPIKTNDYNVKQAHYSHMGSLPVRAALVGPSSTGKTTVICNLLLNHYKGAFEKIYIFSPTIKVDRTWDAVVEYAKKELKQNNNKQEQFTFETYKEEDLQRIIDTQFKVVEYMKNNNYKKLYSICIIVDDFVDNVKFCHSNNSLLNSLYIKGRHAAISTITTTQKFRCLSSVIRTQLTELYVFPLRNNQDLEAVVDEVSAVADKKKILALYRMATSQPHHFLYINLLTHDKSKMFFDSLTKPLIIED
jgi:hypothetical protein